jgi:antitoxin component YwqK of YwqJK toxin-antitoxin module
MRLINYIFLVIIGVFGSCKKQTTNDTSIFSVKEIKNIQTEKGQVKLNPTKGQWFYKQQLFNGHAIAYYKKDVLSEKTGYFNGRREGKAFKYFNDGSLKSEAYFIQNKLHGIKYNYFKNGNVYSESNYKNGKRHGLQKIWFLNGQLAKKKNLIEGKEEGLQQAWRENGNLYVNYEAKNGRIFGLNRANLCYTLKNEKVQYAKKK